MPRDEQTDRYTVEIDDEVCTMWSRVPARRFRRLQTVESAAGGGEDATDINVEKSGHGEPQSLHGASATDHLDGTSSGSDSPMSCSEEPPAVAARSDDERKRRRPDTENWRVGGMDAGTEQPQTKKHVPAIGKRRLPSS